ncbi:MAG: hypothetical protein PBV01_10360 [Brucella anthropi]|jgi:GcrA cell cycle regulator
MKGWHELSIKEKHNAIEKVYGEDGGSASAIAARISHETGFQVSRNAVIGFYARHPHLHTSHPFTGMRVGAALKRTAKALPNGPLRRSPRTTKRLFGVLDQIGEREPEQPAKVEPTEAELYDATALRLTVLELKTRQCRYAVTEVGPHLFCGHPTEPGSSWCDHHHNRIKRPAPEIVKKKKRNPRYA